MKKFFKTFLALSLIGGVFTFTGCKDFGDDINSLDNRLTAVEGTVKDLKSKIEAGSVVTGVESVANGVKVTLSDGKSFVLTNGKDGANGADGKDGVNGTDGKDGVNGTDGKDGKNGSVVTIGENGNWFIDGVDTGMPSRGKDGANGADGKDGANGTDGKDGANGADGKDGADGADGADGIYYYPGANGYWIKVDPNKTPAEETETEYSWIAPDTVTAAWDEENGTLTLAGVEGSEKPIVINLTTVLRSLAFVPEVMAQGLGVIDFYSIYDINGKFAASNQPKVTYRLNPQNANVKGAEWSFINRNVTTKVAGDDNKLISIVSEEAGEKGGMVFELMAQADKLPADATAKGNQVLVALQAAVGGEEVVSDYAFVEKTDLKSFDIINKDKYSAKPSKVVNYYSVPAAADKLAETAVKTAVPLGAKENLTFVYNTSLDINKYLETYNDKVKKSLPEIYVYPTYKVQLVKMYKGADNLTDQQKFVALQEKDGAYTLSVNSEWLQNGGRAAIGRTPVLFVQSIVAGKVVAESYIKVAIVDEDYTEEDKGDRTYVTINGEFKYTEIDPENGEDMNLSWIAANADIFDVLGMSYDEFVANYNINDVDVSYKVGTAAFSNVAPAGVTYDASGLESPTATNAVIVNISNAVKENTSGTVKVTIPAKNNKLHYNVVVEFNYTVSHEHVWPAFNPDYLIGENIIQVKGKLNEDGTSWVMSSSMKEHFKNYLDKFEYEGNHTSFSFSLVEKPVQTGASIDGTDYTDQEIALTEKLEGKSKDYKVLMTSVLANGNKCTKEYIVRFVSPFKVVANPVILKTYQALPDKADLVNYFTVKDNDDKVVFEKGKVTKYGADTYKLKDASADSKGDFTFEYDVKTDASWGGRLKLDGSVLEWNNMGTDLQQDKETDYTVKAAVSNICIIKGEAKVTVLSTAHSK